ncbi:mitotic apparatus protein p62-like [Papaver somniferum]|uniref:mitotic apparatus protein p62-like n=1 Tax=Papaver somniferum TaxID=3469 RepID=UPI000E700313|nr:mitotic apparatus protein p62-like [Papaver somniferum]
MMNKLIEEESQNELDEESERDTESSEREIINKKKNGKRKKNINVSDGEEASSKHKKSKKESNEARKQKTSKKGSPKQTKKVNLGVGPSKKVFVAYGDRPYRAAFNGLAFLVTVMKKRKLLMCFKEATDDEIKFEFVKDYVTCVLTSTPEEFSVITGMSFFEDRQRETKEAMYGGDFKERFQEDEEIDDELEETENELEETEDDEEEEMEQSPNLSEEGEDEEME